MPTSKVPTPAEPESTQVAAEQASSTATTQEAAAQQSTTIEESSGGVTVKTSFPYVEFSGEGFPTITSEGTKLSAEEAKTAQEAANAQGVSLTVEGGEQSG
jgi:hypothetical protein